jgi:hypothetical protein
MTADVSHYTGGADPRHNISKRPSEQRLEFYVVLLGSPALTSDGDRVCG